LGSLLGNYGVTAIKSALCAWIYQANLIGKQTIATVADPLI
jgi:hypothetical protein